jgi:hypothetical protein
LYDLARHYTLYCVGIKLFGKRPRYELSCVPPDAQDFAYGKFLFPHASSARSAVVKKN